MSSFQVVREQFVREFNGMVREYRHDPTGAQIICVENNDANKVFGITFRTPPPDSTGIAHILEHTVLCGSRKYPLKDPFVQLLKGSMQTFLNAMTYPDKTVYPVASQNEQDFYNLVDVYLDAVFFPRITPAFFRQEGWHYEQSERNGGELICKGVVYNEMKGACSSPDNVLMERSQQALFPDNAYGVDSGGDPACIPNLTYPAFRRFHETYYHPSNARIFFYGNDDPAHRLRILGEYLDGFKCLPTPPDTSIPLQPPFERPIVIEEPYAAGEEENKAFVTLNWALPDGLLHFALIVLDQILTGHPGAPLRKALIESDLGEELAGFGLETHLRQPAWSIGLKGVDPADVPAVESLILDTLGTLARDGIDRGEIEAAMNTFEFELRENNHGSFPRGLSVMLTLLETWLYGWDPLGLAAYEHPLAELKEAVASDPRFFEKLIEDNLLNNPHRATVRLMPDAGKAARDEAAERARFRAVLEAMHPDELARTADAAERLLAIQQTPDSPDALRTLPMLRRTDLRKTVRTVPRVIEEHNETTVLYHDLFTSGIVYADIAFDLHALEPDELPWVSILGSLLLESGTRKEDYASLSRRIAQTTGGIHACPLICAPEQSPQSAAWLVLRGKCMSHRIIDLFDLFSDLLFEPAFDDPKRFREVVLEQKSDMESSLVPNGHSAVLSRVKAPAHEAHRAIETISGVDALFFHRDVLHRMEHDWPGIRDTLTSIVRKLLASRRVVNLTADASGRRQIEPVLNAFLARFPDLEKAPACSWVFPRTTVPAEALLAPSRVNYVGCGINLYENGYQMHGSSLVITRYLRTAWLWEQIRVQGGAYGAMCSFDPGCGTFAFASYRDPNLLSTLEAYRRTSGFLKTIELDDDELTRALVGAIGGLDPCLLPDAQGYSDLARYLSGQTDEKRQQRRDEVLATTAEDFRRFGEVLGLQNAVISVLGSQDEISRSGLAFDRRIQVL